MNGLFERWLGGQAPLPAEQHPPATGLQLWLDDQGHVLRLAGPLRTLLPASPHHAARVHDYLQRHSWLVLEGARRTGRGSRWTWTS